MILTIVKCSFSSYNSNVFLPFSGSKSVYQSSLVYLSVDFTFIYLITFGDSGDDSSVVRSTCLERLSTAGFHPLIIDEQLHQRKPDLLDWVDIRTINLTIKRFLLLVLKLYTQHNNITPNKGSRQITKRNVIFTFRAYFQQF